MEETQSREGNCSVSSIPLDYKQKLCTSKDVNGSGDELEFDFAFDVSFASDMASSSAEELFSGGKIRSLTPQLEEIEEQPVRPKKPSSRSPIAQGKKLLLDVFSPRRKKQREAEKKTEQNRDFPTTDQPIGSNQKATLTGSSSVSSSKGSSKKWNLKDLMLFRSASEGRGSEKDHLRKYGTQATSGRSEDVKNGSFRSNGDVRNQSFRSAEGAGSRRRMSAHEMHYAANRAASESLRKKSFLPYNQGILGAHALSTGFGSLGR